MNKTYFGAIQRDIHLDLKFDYTISISFQEMSLSGIETLHHVCELKRTKILQSLALAVLEIPFAGYLLSGNSSNVIEYEGNKLWFYTCTTKYHRYMFLKTNDVTKLSLHSIKIKYFL